jgi:hypothetical protein
MAPGTPVYPNLGDFGLERDLIKAEINAAQQTVLAQMEDQMPKELKSRASLTAGARFRVAPPAGSIFAG